METHLGAGSTMLSRETPRRRTRERTDPPQAAKLRIEICRAVKQILGGEELQTLYANIYKKVELLAISRRLEQAIIADYILDKMEVAFKEYIEPRWASWLLLPDPQTFLDIVTVWRLRILLLLKLFLYVDKCYLVPHPKKPTIEEHGTALLVEATRGEVATLLLKQLRTVHLGLRRGESLSFAKEFFTVLNELKVLGEGEFRSMVSEDYATIADELDVSHFVPSLLTSLSQDCDFFKSCGFSETVFRAEQTEIQWSHIFDDFAGLLKRSLPYLTENQNHQFLRALCRMAEKAEDIHGLEAENILLYAWEEYVRNRVYTAVTQATPVNFIEVLQTEYSALVDICTLCFLGKVAFDSRLKAGISKALSQPMTNAASHQLLLRSCDAFMKQPDNAEVFLDTFSFLFELIPGKMAFINAYTNSISRRLLLGRNANVDLEKRIVERISRVVGADALADIRSMLADYAQAQHTHESEAVFSALVLGKKHWPELLLLAPLLVVPERLQQILDSFGEQYKLRDPKWLQRNLDWSSYTLHQLTLSVGFDKEPKDLQVNLLQAAVLLLFEEKETYTMAEILDLTKIQPKQLLRVLASLTGKYRILLVDGTNVTWNNAFTDRAKKLKFPMTREREVGDKAVDTTVKRDAASEIQAFVVRTLKLEQKVHYQILLGDTLKHFETNPVAVLDIKRQVEQLVNGGYLSREGDDIVYVP